MKKQILKLSVLSLLSIGTLTALHSCRDAIDIVQPGEVNAEKLFTSLQNIEGALNDVYNSTDITEVIQVSALISDEVKTNNILDNVLFTHTFNSNNVYSSALWLSYYELILKANRFLEGVQNYTPTSSETNQYNKAIAQAKVLRAFAYTQLLTHFSEDLTQDDGNGVIISNATFLDATSQLPRSSNKAVENVILKDLDEAYDALDQGSRYFVSKNFVNALKARFYLYRGNFAQAKIFAQKVVTESGLSLTPAGNFTQAEVQTQAWRDAFYKDNSNSPYRRVWSDADQGEVIFALSRPVRGTGATAARLFTSNGTNIQGAILWFAGTNITKIISETQGDIRRYAYIDPTSPLETNGAVKSAVIDKYPGKGVAALRNDLKVVRLSEIYFILAECATHEGNLVEARNYIQKVREARNYLGAATTPHYANQQEAWADILKERRVELAFEGHRYIDLKRVAAKAGVTMDRVNADVHPIPLLNLPNGDYRYTLPIPLSELSANPNVVQNKGY
ncbi:RagB/SusD family nutrient uptake outer membrane protein [Bergeyella zoohelcum]|uniref:SusD family n=1 Tax=Bergeyella zoohelcum TaxID=1015 RepID=A0A376C0A6_9FLAO|nr:RagB/SusD family nutrient uptake outer membrane protein [Bergeyella zoohelcum]EKB57047.1 hypothetical protein HMPREF9700_02264 [Bergeyella zoohelcum CCUG 30536]SSZ55597.1 SusD family [Bergeyella zoohelcum]